MIFIYSLEQHVVKFLSTFEVHENNRIKMEIDEDEVKDELLQKVLWCLYEVMSILSQCSIYSNTRQ